MSAWGLWQVIELGRDIMPTNIFTKFDQDRMKHNLNFGQFKDHNSGAPRGFGWL